MENKVITVLVDNDSWIIPFAHNLVQNLCDLGWSASFVGDSAQVRRGWINFMLGCTKIVPEEILQRNEHNLVVHESALPEGRGFAPMAWQILEGKNSIPICLLEAANEVDAGDVWLQDTIELSGTELCDEWRLLQGKKTVELCLKFVCDYSSLEAARQRGEPTYYPRRRPTDSRLEVNRTIEEQFELLRVADNVRYPAHFEFRGQIYTIQIYKSDGLN